MNTDQALRRLSAHGVGHAGTDVTPLRYVARVAEATHQLCPGPAGLAQVPADLLRLT